VLLTHSPLRAGIATRSAFDLHVLSTPPAFILSQDQTLRLGTASPVLPPEWENLLWAGPSLGRRREGVEPARGSRSQAFTVCFLSHLSC
jgi:hypothetical protein